MPTRAAAVAWAVAIAVASHGVAASDSPGLDANISAMAAVGGGYSEGEALAMAYLSTAAYCQGGLESWDCGHACSQVRGMQDVRRVGTSFVGKMNGKCVLAFRGTDSVSGWSRNLQSLETTPYSGCGGCRVGVGFLEAYQAMAGGIKQKLAEIGCGKSDPLSITGHSFGGVMATLAVFDMGSSGQALSTCYTFGSPRVGNAAFANAFNARFGGLNYRVTRPDDPIVFVPFRGQFHHVGREVYYRWSSYRVCNGSGEDSSCAGERRSATIALLALQCVIPNACGHYRYLQPRKRGLMIRGCSRRKGDEEDSEQIILP